MLSLDDDVIEGKVAAFISDKDGPLYANMLALDALGFAHDALSRYDRRRIANVLRANGWVQSDGVSWTRRASKLPPPTESTFAELVGLAAQFVKARGRAPAGIVDLVHCLRRTGADKATCDGLGSVAGDQAWETALLCAGWVSA